VTKGQKPEGRLTAKLANLPCRIAGLFHSPSPRPDTPRTQGAKLFRPTCLQPSTKSNLALSRPSTKSEAQQVGDWGSEVNPTRNEALGALRGKGPGEPRHLTFGRGEVEAWGADDPTAAA
jgi:hypothetical protein